MNKLISLKELIYNELLNIVDKKIATAKQAIESAKESRDNDTKSSVGDKYETGRVMMQIEMENHEIQLSKALKQKGELLQINIKKEYKKAASGSLVITNQGNYFISIGIGKIDVNNEIFFSISLASPLGMLIFDKKVGAKFQFQEKKFTIKNIV
ncbi:MAG: hypothetical protein JXR51_09760 [Bacteroidales bacterium]|nr:hypothetical protein [Bacteroidales bacterium]MBN2757451.1 hypothetical protein [Bacteroidales bacterium]